MFPDDLIERNSAFVFHRQTQALPAAAAIPLVVVTCFDPRLDPLLRPAMGLGEDEGFFLRTPGAVVAPGSVTLRTLALAVLMMGAHKIFVLGHSSCRMAKFETRDFIEIFRGRDVPREAFGAEDLRTWAGAIANPRQGVLESAAVIAAAPVLPRDVEIAAGVLDDTTGKIDVVLRPGEAVLGVGAAAPPVDPTAGNGSEEAASPEEASIPPAASLLSRSPPPTPPPTPLPPAVETVHSAVDFLASQSQMASQLYQLRQGLSHESNPFKQLALIRQFLQSGAADTAELKAALDQLRHEIKSQPSQFLSQLFLPLLDREKR